MYHQRPFDIRLSGRRACSCSRAPDCPAWPSRPARQVRGFRQLLVQPGRLRPGLAPLTVPAVLSAQSTGLTVTVSLVTQPVPLPAATAAALPQLSYLGIEAAPANGMSGTR